MRSEMRLCKSERIVMTQDKEWIYHRLLIGLSMLFMIQKSFAQSSENYQIKKSVLNQGGALSQFTNYQAFGTAGQPGVGTQSSENYGILLGFLAGSESGSVKVEQDELVVPEAFRLLQNYPNPLNSESVIEYHLPAAGDVTLFIFNTKGEIIRRFDRSTMAAGIHSFHWDGRDEAGDLVSSGTYLYRIDFKSNHDFYSAARKMVFLK